MPKQQLHISYDSDVKILNIMTSNRGVTSTSLRRDYDVDRRPRQRGQPQQGGYLEILNPTD